MKFHNSIALNPWISQILFLVRNLPVYLHSYQIFSLILFSSFLPTFMSSKPSTNTFSSTPSYDPNISNQPTSCIDCINITSPNTEKYNEVCCNIKLIMYEMCNDDDKWVEGAYFQDSCHSTGYGYPDYLVCTK